jgi:protein-disulfide isomerase
MSVTIGRSSPLPLLGLLAALTALAGCTGASAPMTRAEGEALRAEVAELKAELAQLKAAQAAAPAAPVARDLVRLPNASGHGALGRADAPVTIVEFTDLQCPYCARFARDTFPQLLAELIEAGKVRFVTRDLPLAAHTHAVTAAVAARCAEEQQRYWEYRAALFARQGALANPDSYRAAADEAGVDVARLEACRQAKGEEYAAAARADRNSAHRIGITGTPSFVVGRSVAAGPFTGERIVGSKPYAVFEAAVEAALAETGTR